MARTRGRTTVRREEEDDDVDDATGVEKEKKAGRHPYFCNRRKGSKCVSSPRKLRRRRDAATPTTKEREEEQKRDGEADEIFRREVGDELGGICLYRNRGFVRRCRREVSVSIRRRAPRSSETTNFEERLKAMEEIQRCEVKLERAKEKVEELVTKILEEKRKLRLQRQRRGLFTLWTEFSAGENSEAVSSWTAMVAVVTYFTAISMISLWFWKLVNFAYFGALGEMEESSFFKTATTTATKSESGKSVSAKKDDEGEQENPIDSYAKVARHLNHNDTTVNKSSVSPSSSLRGSALGTTWAFPNRSPRLLKDVRSYHQPSLTNDNNTKNNKKKQTTSRLSLNIRATKKRHMNQSLLIDGREKTQ